MELFDNLRELFEIFGELFNITGEFFKSLALCYILVHFA